MTKVIAPDDRLPISVKNRATPFIVDATARAEHEQRKAVRASCGWLIHEVVYAILPDHLAWQQIPAVEKWLDDIETRAPSVVDRALKALTVQAQQALLGNKKALAHLRKAINEHGGNWPHE